MRNAKRVQDRSIFFLCLRVIFTGLFILTLLAGVWLVRNRERFFGIDPTMPHETSGARLYGKTLIFVIWAHAAAITGGFALMFR